MYVYICHVNGEIKYWLTGNFQLIRSPYLGQQQCVFKPVRKSQFKLIGAFLLSAPSALMVNFKVNNLPSCFLAPAGYSSPGPAS